jgi:hypothetical protein
MTLLTKGAISALIAFVSAFMLIKPPAPTPDDLQPRYDTIYEAYSQPTTILTTSTTAPAQTLCGQVFNMAKHIGWPLNELSTVVAVSIRESRCQVDAFNAKDPNGGSAGVMQINYFWCKPSQYWPRGYLQAHGLLNDCAELFDLETNLRAALAIYRYSEGWRAWSL